MFTENELEKDPLKEVAAEPYELLDKTRYDFSSKQLPEEREVQLESIMSKLREECTIKGIMVRTLSSSFTGGGMMMSLQPVQPSKLLAQFCVRRQKYFLINNPFFLYVKTAFPDLGCSQRPARTNKCKSCCNKASSLHTL